jgi:predicted N-acyltransferase
MDLRAELISDVTQVGEQDWAALDTGGNPFLSQAFLAVLEQTGCVGGSTGWSPRHLVIRDAAGRVQTVVPQYLKEHSWGEFVFDWNWARAYVEAGFEYYPKLLAAIPFTPVTGPRLLLRQDADGAELRRLAAGALQQAALDGGCSGAHVNFTLPEDQAALESAGFMPREDVRFLWRNHDYRDFEDFLATFRADKRKKLRRERRRVQESGIVFRTLHGDDIDPQLWRIVFGFSERTFLRHGNAHYLSPQFFELLSERMPGSVMVKLAERAGHAIGAAIFLRGADGLYGRYWGSEAYEDSLHFEACYYQGIEYCIAEGLASFDPGTQGEHKLARGFQPVLTKSAHWLAHPAFAGAVARYLEREREAVRRYAEAAAGHLPFQRVPSP